MSLSQTLGDSQCSASSKGTESSTANAAELLRAIEASQSADIEAASATAARMVEDKLPSFKRELTGEAAAKAAKKARGEKRPEFKRKGNEHQYARNEAVMDKVDEAIADTERGDIYRTKEALQEGKALLLKRQKLIRLADREECGWDDVQEYLSDELASDSDDEKHIARSRKAAAAKRKKSNSANSGRQSSKNRRSRPFFQSNQRGPIQGSAGPVASSPQQFSGPSDGRWAHPLASRQNAIRFACGQKGHLQYACTNRASN